MIFNFIQKTFNLEIFTDIYFGNLCYSNKPSRTTNRVHATFGKYLATQQNDNKMVNIFDTIGLCDGNFTDDQTIEYVKSFLQDRIEYLEKVIVVISGKKIINNNSIRLFLNMYIS